MTGKMLREMSENRNKNNVMNKVWNELWHWLLVQPTNGTFTPCMMRLFIGVTFKFYFLFKYYIKKINKIFD